MIALVLALICLSQAGRLWADGDHHLYTFEDFKSEFNRNYPDAEEEARRGEIFQARLQHILAHNADKTKTWKEGVNQFTDLTQEEFRKNFLGLKGVHRAKAERAKNPFWKSQPFSLYKGVNVSDFLGVNIDWRTKGVVTPPKNQGACGSCWTFATAETIESYNALATNPKQLLTLSEQQILDCTPNPDQCGGTGGCGGGTVELAVARIVVMGGLSTESSYPYVSGDGENFPCDSKKFKPAVKVKNYIDLPSNALAPVLAHVATEGPLAISVDASTWSGYSSGVFDGCNNQNPDLDHAVQLVGYGTDPQYGDYWLVRNSWGQSYGEQGYIRLKRFTNPPCGVDTTPSDGDGCANGPPQVTVCGNCGILYDTTYVTIAK